MRFRLIDRVSKNKVAIFPLVVLILASQFSSSVFADTDKPSSKIELNLRFPTNFVAGASGGGSLVIGEVVDKRKIKFEPRTRGSTPSMLVGRYEAAERIYEVVLVRDKTVQSVVREIVDIGFARTGVEVVDAPDGSTETLPIVDIYIESFWVEAEQIDKYQNGPFICTIALRLVSQDPLYDSMGVVRARGYLNGKRPFRGGSYGNAINHTLEGFFTNFQADYDAALASSFITDSSPERAIDSEDDLLESLIKAKELYEAGALTEDEYSQLKSKLLNGGY